VPTESGEIISRLTLSNEPKGGVVRELFLNNIGKDIIDLDMITVVGDIPLKGAGAVCAASFVVCIIAILLCLFRYFLLLRRRLSSDFVAERCATTPLTYLGSYTLVRLIFAAVERIFPLSLNPSIAGV